MALLNPIANCKVGDVNAFYTSLEGSLASSIPAGNSMQYHTPYVKTVTFSRTETLTRSYFHWIMSQATMATKTTNFSLTQYKSCTVSATTPALITITAHGYTTGDKVRFTATTIPTGMIRGGQYFVNVQSANTFWIYDTYANAIAGGTTGRIDTTTTGTTVVCHKIISEQTYIFNTIFSKISQVTGGSRIVLFTLDFNIAVTNAGSTWAYLVSTDDSTFTSPASFNAIASFGSTTATAVSGTDNFLLDRSVDFSSGFTFNAPIHLSWNANADNWLNPNFLYDPSASSLGNITLNTNCPIISGSYSGYSFGKPLTFTSQLSAGDTSATLTVAHSGTTGTHLLQLFPRGEDDDFQQISATFTNGSTAVTFSALTYNATDRGGICLKKSAPLTLTMNAGSDIGSSSSQYMATAQSILCEETRKMYALTTAGVSAGATSMTVDRNTGWAINDTFVIGGQILKTSGSGDINTIYTITGITAGAGTDTITFSPAITATYDRTSGSPVGITEFKSNNALNIVRPSGSSIFNLQGVSSVKNFIGIQNNSFYSINSQDALSDVDMPFYTYKTAGPNIATSLGRLGAFYREVVISGSASQYSYATAGLSGFSYPPTYVNDLVVLRHSGFPAQIATTFPFNFKNVIHDGVTGIVLQSEGYKIDNFKVWLCITSTSFGTGIGIQNLFSNDIKNIYADNCLWGVGSFTGVCTIQNVYLGTRGTNTYDVYPSSSGFGQIELKNVVTNSPADTSTKQTNMSPRGYIALTDIDGVEGNTRILYKYGESTISGSGLADTTSRVGNRQLVAFATSNSGETQWTQVIPTGDIQNKDMMVGVWCKIDSSAYWGGSHTMPRITINYDDGTEVYAEAGQLTDWQFLFVPFTPTTTFGSITSKLSIQSDNNSNVYWGDMSVLYPAGYTLNLGAFNNLRSGLPVTPTISTSVSAQDVWSADPTQFGASTVGDKVNKIKKIVTGLQ